MEIARLEHGRGISKRSALLQRPFGPYRTADLVGGINHFCILHGAIIPALSSPLEVTGQGLIVAKSL